MMNDPLNNLATVVSGNGPGTRSTKPKSPSFWPIYIGSLVFRIIGSIFVVFSVYQVVVSLDAKDDLEPGVQRFATVIGAFDIDPAAIWIGLLTFAIGAVLLMFGWVALAIRDIARNSFR